ncbi:hypothetical protein ANO14919_139630 [Xylariales sp. No.14919]|nr:hypothetical protein ANO14919_139630 [Xylariales sp. No.14919]
MASKQEPAEKAGSVSSVDACAVITQRAVTTYTWEKWVPGPSASYCFKGLSPVGARAGFAGCGCIIFILSGYNTSLFGSVSSVDSYREIVGLGSGSSHDSVILGIISASYWLGVIAGALFCGWISDLVGRRKTIVCFCILGLVVVPLLTALENFAWALVLRILNGAVTGALDSATLTWSAETTHHKRRGRAIAMELAVSAYGAGFAYFSVYGLTSEYSSTVVWRLPIAIQLILIFITLALIWFLPESPRWLIKMGRVSEVHEVLKTLSSFDQDDEGRSETGAIQSTVESIEHALDVERQFEASSNYFTILFRPDRFSTPRRSWTALFIQFSAQFLVGGGLIAAYGISVFETGGWPARTATLLTGVTFVVVATSGMIGAIFFADRLGRRNTFACGALIGGILTILIGVCALYVSHYSETDNALSKRYSIGVVALQFIWGVNFGLTWLWCAFLYPAEIFPTESRSMGSALSVIGFALGAFTCNEVGSYIYNAITYKAFFIFGSLSVLVGVICWFLVLETKNKTLEDVNNLYGKVDKSIAGERPQDGGNTL